MSNDIFRAISDYFKKTGRAIYSLIDQAGGIIGLFVASMATIFHMSKNQKNLIYREVIRQIYFTGFMGASLVVTIAFIIGFIVTFYLSQFSALITIDIEGQIFSIIVIRELGPLLTAILIVARSSTAISAEIATMMLTHEYEAVEISGADPLQIIVLPRLIGVIISMLALNILFDAVGIFGGVFTNKLLNPDIQYIPNVLRVFYYLSALEIFIIILKSLVLGAIVSITSVYAGFKLPNKAPSVAVSTQRGVMLGILWVFVADVFITILFYITRI